MERVEHIGDHPEDLFAFAVAEMSKGNACVLVIILNVEGSSSRSVGTPMIVVEDGRYAGYVSNGCLDADIAGQSLDTLRSGQPREVRYGKGSPYLDLRLPCGGGLDVVFLPNPDVDVMQKLTKTLQNRQAAEVTIKPKFSIGADGDVVFNYTPRLRILGYGQGVEAESMERVARASNLLVLTNPSLDEIATDPWTAIILLFHDHDKEIDILTKAVKTSAFYIGAMGSRHSQAARLAALAANDISEANLGRIKGPIGLVPSARDSGRLAISVLAEVFDIDRQRTLSS